MFSGPDFTAGVGEVVLIVSLRTHGQEVQSKPWHFSALLLSAPAQGAKKTNKQREMTQLKQVLFSRYQQTLMGQHKLRSVHCWGPGKNSAGLCQGCRCLLHTVHL